MNTLYLCLFSTLFLFTGLIAGETDTSTTKAKDRTFVVGFAQDTLDNDWRNAQVREVTQALAAFPAIRFIVTDAHGRTAQQIMDIENLADQGVDLLMTSPRDASVQAPAISAVYRRGIPIVLLTRRIPGEDYTTFISPDDAAIAASAAELLAMELRGRGRILVLQGVPTASTAVQRTRGFMEALKDYPGIEIADTRVGNYLRSDALLEMERVLAEGIGFDAIFAQSDSMAAGARMALRAVGIDPKTVPIVGIDYIAEARQAIRNGEQLASFTYPTCGREGAEQVIKILNGQPFKRHVIVDSLMVTRENVEQVDPIF